MCRTEVKQKRGEITELRKVKWVAESVPFFCVWGRGVGGWVGGVGGRRGGALVLVAGRGCGY